jgi:NADH:ubiquinone oxidoreductase subunit F (NADH-binding)/NADH:ubiquinone oxidoreductase subunit E
MHPKTLKHKPVSPEVEALTAKYNHDPEALLEVLQELQSSEGFLSPERIGEVAHSLRIPQHRVQGLATFYTMLKTTSQRDNTLRICDGPVCWLRGAKEIGKHSENTLGDQWNIVRNSCLGLCDRAPAALVNGDQCGPLSQQDVDSLLDQTWKHTLNPDYSNPRPSELREMLLNAGEIDATSIDSALAYGAYRALAVTLGTNESPVRPAPPKTIIEMVETAGIRGRGGAGFPVGRKWAFVAAQARTPKYVVCNADESEPLVFKDRVLMEMNPHQLLEGMALAAYAVGAAEGFIYIRGEYKYQAQLLEHAITQAVNAGYLGEHILGSSFSFHIHVHRGAGAYICGEETALLESLEGKRGEPRMRPPYPVTSGYRGQPTVVNNVESLAVVPHIVLHGVDWYRNLGNPNSPGTKIYTLLGHINHPGLFEAPIGLTLREMIETFGGGMRSGSDFHFALTGGAAGTIVPSDLLDVPIDYDSQKKGVSLGAGAFLICDQTVSPVALLRELLHFFEVESCGKCTPCRVGTRQAREILDRLVAGKRSQEDISKLAQLAETLEKTSFCGLGQSAAWSIKSALVHFGAAFN